MKKQVGKKSVVVNLVLGQLGGPLSSTEMEPVLGILRLTLASVSAELQKTGVNVVGTGYTVAGVCLGGTVSPPKRTKKRKSR